MKQVVQTLQLALEKEKTKVKDLKEQVRGRVQSASLHLNLKLKFKLHNFLVMLSQSILIGCVTVLCTLVGCSEG